MLRPSLLLVFAGLLSCSIQAQQKIVKLYNGVAPGTESWNWREGVSEKNMFNTKVVYNVTQPSMEVFAPDSMSSAGTAAIICPGGGFHTLSINSEGNDVAKWLVKKGVTCFVLKYRLVHSLTDDPVAEMMQQMGKPQLDDQHKLIIPMAIDDGRAAIAYVRAHAAEFGIKPDRVGIIGFSAGGTVAAGAAFNYTPANKPDFVAPVYAFFPDSMSNIIPADAPPMFLAAASDDQLGLAPHSANLYNKWIASKHQAELHMYVKGGHGFGMRIQHLPSDTWIDRLGDWLKVNGYLQLLHPPEWTRQYTEVQIEEFKKKDEERQRNDWANLGKYTAENEQLAMAKTTNPRIVFMGNSITEGWKQADSAFFAPGKNYIDRGISGQTTPQMVLRFRQDVIDLEPAVVVILAGINDIAQNTGPMTLEQTFGNIVSMAELAKANNIKVVISSVLPAYDFPWRPGLQPAEKVIKLNAMLEDYAAAHNMGYLDYFTAMKDERNGLKSSLTYDDVHPTREGYKVMEPLAEKAIAEALKKK